MVAEYILETIEVKAAISVEEDGGCDYSGDASILWDTQTPVATDNGSVTLGCAQGHEWFSHM